MVAPCLYNKINKVHLYNNFFTFCFLIAIVTIVIYALAFTYINVTSVPSSSVLPSYQIFDLATANQKSKKYYKLSYDMANENDDDGYFDDNLTFI